jgi:L-ascorbate metabolism protein UlaG (beta-lactamase superfamily)
MYTESLTDRPLSLSNDGRLELFFIGVGSAFTKRNYQTNLLIVKGDDHLLVDCGTKCPQAFHELGVPLTDVSNLLITHSHADHIGGLEEIALMGRYAVGRKPRLFAVPQYERILWDMSLRGGAAFNENHDGTSLQLTDFFSVSRPRRLENYPRETYELEAGSINLKIMRTMHIPDSSMSWQSSFWSCGLIVDDRIFFTSDTRYDPDLVSSFEERFRFQQIFHDCQFFTGGVHASLEEIKNFSPGLKERMFLTHYGDNWEQYENKVREYGFAGLTRQHVHYMFD